MPRKASGLTLFEMLLVMAIGTTLLVMGMRMYRQYSTAMQASRLYGNVQQLQATLKNYYQANCRQTLGVSGNALSQGALDPAVIGNAQTLRITINSGVTANTDLFSMGYLSAATWRPLNPLVLYASSTDDGYYLQFNRIQPTVAGVSADVPASVYACAGSSLGPRVCSVTSASVVPLMQTSGSTLQSRVVFWAAQVGVRLRRPSQIFDVLGPLGATCATLHSTDTCETAAVTPTGTEPELYAVWETPPSLITENSTSSLWLSLPRVKQFNMQYTNDGMATLSGVQYNTATGVGSVTWYNPQNYLCGG